MQKLDKYIAGHSSLSRRRAYDLIGEGKVLVNGKEANYSTKIKTGDRVEADGVLIVEREVKPVVLAYHKPKGIICTGEKIKDNIIDAVNYGQKIFPVGRLDKDSEGLILLTNVGELINRIGHPRFEHEKEYEVTLNLPVRKKFLEEISKGTDIGGVVTAACEVRMVTGTKRVFRIILKQGLNRQIRRMCNKFGYQVLKLKRLRVMQVELGKLKPGEWRELNIAEMEMLDKNSAGH